jgi:hypothetical protein
MVDFSKRPLPVNLDGALSLPITQPGFLVQITANAVDYFFSTRGTVDWNGDTYAPYNLSLSGATWGEDFVKSLVLSFGGVNDALAALVLPASFISSRVRVSVFYEGTDAYQVFDGVVESVEIGDQQTQIKCTLENTRVLLRPGYRMRRDTGFPYLPVAGTLITFKNLQWTLEVPEE